MGNLEIFKKKMGKKSCVSHILNCTLLWFINSLQIILIVRPEPCITYRPFANLKEQCRHVKVPLMFVVKACYVKVTKQIYCSGSPSHLPYVCMCMYQIYNLILVAHNPISFNLSDILCKLSVQTLDCHLLLVIEAVANKLKSC